MKQTSSKKFLFSIESFKDSASLNKSIATYLREIGALNFGSVGSLEISVDYEIFDERQIIQERRSKGCQEK